MSRIIKIDLDEKIKCRDCGDEITVGSAAYLGTLPLALMLADYRFLRCQRCSEKRILTYAENKKEKAREST